MRLTFACRSALTASSCRRGARMSTDTANSRANVERVRADLIGKLQRKVRCNTRFDARDLSVTTVSVSESRIDLGYVFAAKIGYVQGRGKGRGQCVVAVASPERLKVHMERDQAFLREKLEERLAEWEMAQRAQLIPEMRNTAFLLKGSRDAHCDLNCGTCQATGSVICTSCRGQGEVTCGKCDGARQHVCSRCNGMRTLYRGCDACGGRGRLDEWHWVSQWDHHTQSSRSHQVNRPVSCHRCFGHGGLQVACTNCSGTGQEWCVSCRMSGSVRCNGCAGSGAVGCQGCSATGIVHVWYAAKVSTSSRRMVIGVSGGDASKEAFQHADGSLNHLCSEWNPGAPEFKPQAVLSRRLVTVPYAKASFDIGEGALTLLALGKDYEIQNYGGLGDRLLREDVKALDSALASGNARHADAAGRQLFKSEICGTVGELLRENLVGGETSGASKKVSQATSNFVSERFVDELRVSLNRLIWKGYVAVHRAGLIVAVLAGVAASSILKFAPNPLHVGSLPWYVPALLVAVVALASQVHMRRFGMLAMPIGDERRLVSLLKNHPYGRFLEQMYLVLFIVFGAMGYWLTHR